jgi:magnesium transporter
MPIKNFKLLTQLPPGTIKYTGKQKPLKTKMEVISYNMDKFSRSEISDIAKLPSDSSKFFWLNVIGMQDTMLINSIGERFGIHKIDLEGIVDVLERSKVEDRQSYLFSILKMVYIQNDRVVHEHISVILCGNYIITFQEHEADVFDAVRERLEKDLGQVRKMGADYLFNSLLDSVIDRYYSIIHYIEERFSEAENSIIMENRNEMKKVYWLRKELLYLKNSLEPVHISLKNIIQYETPLISAQTIPYIRDVEDNVTQIMEEISTFREMVNSLYETQMSNSGNDMNRIMMTLTIFSAIFIPLSFLAGIFGMNFASVPGLSNPSSFIIFCAGCVTIAALMLIFFKLRKWF